MSSEHILKITFLNKLKLIIFTCKNGFRKPKVQHWLV